MITLSQEAARGLMIAAQGLHDAPRPPATKDDVLAEIRRIRLLQIDSINVVARAPYFVLWSRLGAYDPRWLDKLLEEAKLFEFWAHAVCFQPIEDYGLYREGSRINDWKKIDQWMQDNRALADRMLDYIEEHGDVRASDFENMDGQKRDWEHSKEEKVVLDYLVFSGELMIRKRENFQRIYDLRSRIFPDYDKLPKLSAEESYDQMVLNTIRALGVTKRDWIANYYRMKSSWVNGALKRLGKQGKLLEVEVEGWKSPVYADSAQIDRIEAAAAGDIPQSKTTLLSPFDPLVWDEGRVRELFNFDFPIEFYFPEAKRKYGYFSLPILYQNRLIGRLDPKVHRQEAFFEVKSIHFEADVVVDDPIIRALRETLKACADWHNVPRLVVRTGSEPDLSEVLSD